MTTKTIAAHLQAFLTNRQHDPVVDPLTARVSGLEADLRAADGRVAAARAADEAANLEAETALAAGKGFDDAVLRRLRTDVDAAEHRRRIVANAVELVRRDAAKARAERAARDAATLTPLFAELAALYHERALALLEVDDLLGTAHTAATATLPAASSLLQQGFKGGAITHQTLAAWRERAEVAGLLPSLGQRVA